ncbi:hypothetical protein J3E74DRAFT_287268 [Bipolaris maydis]|nr:hypothetical protein J3E74DRAFT_287268 [Bipolaris maydis]
MGELRRAGKWSGKKGAARAAIGSSDGRDQSRRSAGSTAGPDRGCSAEAASAFCRPLSGSARSEGTPGQLQEQQRQRTRQAGRRRAGCLRDIGCAYDVPWEAAARIADGAKGTKHGRPEPLPINEAPIHWNRPGLREPGIIASIHAGPLPGDPIIHAARLPARPRGGAACCLLLAACTQEACSRCSTPAPWTLDGGAGRGGKGGRGGQTRADAASLGRAASAMADGRHLCLCFSQATVSGHDATRYVGDCAAWTVAASSRDDQRARPGAERSSRHPAPPSDYPPSPASRAIGHCSPAMPFSRPRRSGTLLSLGWIRPKLAFNRHLVHAPKWEALTSCSRCTMLVSGGCVV